MRIPRIIWTALLVATAFMPAARGATCDGYCTLEGLDCHFATRIDMDPAYSRARMSST